MWRFFLRSSKKIEYDQSLFQRVFLESEAIIAIALLLLLIIPFYRVSAQSNISIQGYVYDEDDGAPIIGASVELMDSGYKVVTDNYGIFTLEHLPSGRYSLKITASGYECRISDEINIVSDITRRMVIRLSKKVYELDKIVVTARKTSLTGERVTTITRDDIEREGITDLPQLLETVGGVLVQKTGSGGGSQVKIRGSDPGHVLVLLDGQKMNPSGSGIADLSGIPIDMVERVEVHKGGASAEFGPDALSGAINIITRPTKLFENLSVDGGARWGRWNTNSTHLNIANPLHSPNFSSRWSYQSKHSDGDFDYAYTVSSPGGSDSIHTGTRLNNAFYSDNYFTSGIYKFSANISLNYSGQYYNSERGLPDRVTAPNLTARMTDRRRLLTTGVRYVLSPDHSMELTLGISQFRQHFLDADTANPLPYNSDFINDIITLQHNHDYSFWRGNNSRYSIQYRREKLNHTDNLRTALSMGKTARNGFSTMIASEQNIDISKLEIFDIVTFDAAFRFDMARTNKDSTSYQDTVRSNSIGYWSPKVGATLSKGDKFAYIIRGSYGKSFRLPTINALFWKGDTRSSGNPGLKPEKSEHSEASAELKLDFKFISLSGGLTYFHSHIRDLVVWTPNAQGIWRPDNLALAQITGHEDFARLGILNDQITFSYQNTISTALNKTPGHNRYNKRLTFSPEYITAITAGFNISPLCGSYSVRLVDKAYTNEANTRYYDAYRLDDLQAGLRIDISRLWRISTDVRIDNIRDVDYVLMTHYPMPGRAWSVFAKISYGLQENK